MKNRRVVIPCNGCTLCCQREKIILHPEFDDNEDDYLTEEYEGRTTLRNKPNGDCIYLDRKTGCTIWDNQPAVCQGLDCRAWLRIPKKSLVKLIKNGSITKKHIAQAKYMKNKMRLMRDKNGKV
jgi:hypothetical protein